MTDDDLILKLAKVIIAAGWADGQLTEDEINNLKGLLLRLRQTSSGRGVELPGREWARLEMYIEEPVGVAERGRLVADLEDSLHTAEQKRLVVEALYELVRVDGEVSPEELAVLEEVEAAVEDSHLGIFGSLRRLVGGGPSSSSRTAGAPNREQYFDDYLRNKVYYSLARRQRQGELELDLSEEEQRKLGLAGGLMSKVAHIDGEVSDAEFENMVQAIRRHWKLSEESAGFVAESALAAISNTYDPVRMMSELAGIASKEERRAFLTALFALAAADGHISIPEHEEIRFITRGIGLHHEDFIAAKLQVLHAE